MLTERLALRRCTTVDAANLLSLNGDPQVMRFLTGTTRSLAQIRDEVLPDLAGCHLRFPRVRVLGRGDAGRRRVHRLVRAAAGHAGSASSG